MSDANRTSHTASKVFFAEKLVGFGASLRFDARETRQDLQVLQDAFPKPEDYDRALLEVLRYVTALMAGLKRGADLKGPLSGWQKCKGRSSTDSSGRDDLRIVFRALPNCVELLGFGHRDEPWDLYGYIGARAMLRAVSGKRHP